MPLGVIQGSEDGEGICEIGQSAETFADASNEDKANAALISAAPDLLAACKAALRAMRTGNSEVTAIERLVAAIEKAGGQ